MTIKRGEATLKIYSPEGDFLGSAVYAEDAAAMICNHRTGSTIRNGHSKKNTVWTEGEEEKAAGESYDFVAQTVYSRIK